VVCAQTVLVLLSRLNLDLTFTAVSFLLALWGKAVTTDKRWKRNIKLVQRVYNVYIYVVRQAAR
jgi:hypothetical protein